VPAGQCFRDSARFVVEVMEASPEDREAREDIVANEAPGGAAVLFSRDCGDQLLDGAGCSRRQASDLSR